MAENITSIAGNNITLDNFDAILVNVSNVTRYKYYHDSDWSGWHSYAKSRGLIANVVRGLILVLGLIGNSLLAVHLVRRVRQRGEARRQINAFYCLLVNFLVVAILWLCVLNPIHFYIQRKAVLHRWTAGEGLCQFYFYLLYTLYYAMMYSVVLLVIYQCAHVLRPKLIGPFDTWPWGAIACGVFWALILTGNIYRGMQHGTVRSYRKMQQFENITLDTDEIPEHICHYNYRIDSLKSTILFGTFSVFLPSLLMLVGTVVLIGSLRHSGRGYLYNNMDEDVDDLSREASERHKQEKQQATRMVIILTISKFVCSVIYQTVVMVFLAVRYNHAFPEMFQWIVALDVLGWFNTLHPAIVPFIIFSFIPDLRPWGSRGRQNSQTIRTDWKDTDVIVSKDDDI